MGDTLTLRRIEMVNFRSFAEAALSLDERLTVVVADNGGGKTATLDALSVALAALVPSSRGRRRKDSPPHRGLDLVASDAHSVEVLPPYSLAAFPVRLRCEGELRGTTTSWETLLVGAEESSEERLPPEAANVAGSGVMRQRPAVDLPVIAYYGTDRATGSLTSKRMPNLGKAQRSLGYKNSLASSVNYAEITAWLAQTEWERTSTRGTPWEAALHAVYEATTNVLASLGATAVSYSLEERDLVVSFATETGGERLVPMSLASDGYRSVLALTADLAFRCSSLNAHFDSDSTQLTDGVVLIDEIDMHLHPRWQAHVLADLLRAFPRIQFVVTTHSPLVVSSVDSAQVRSIAMDNGESQILAVARETKGADIEYISEAIFDAPTRGDSEFAAELAQFGRFLATGDLAAAARPAERIRRRLETLTDFDAERLLREYDWRVRRVEQRERNAAD